MTGSNVQGGCPWRTDTTFIHYNPRQTSGKFVMESALFHGQIQSRQYGFYLAYEAVIEREMLLMCGLF